MNKSQIQTSTLFISRNGKLEKYNLDSRVTISNLYKAFNGKVKIKYDIRNNFYMVTV